MGAAASIHVEDSELTETQKAEIFTALKAKYDKQMEQLSSGNGDSTVTEAQLLENLKKEYIDKVSGYSTAHGADGNPTGDPMVLEGAVPEAEAASTAEAFAKKMGELGATASTSEFRKRRLSVTASAMKPLTPTGQTNSRRTSTVLYKSQDIGAEKEMPLPFPETVVGTYSCPGLEPSYYKEDGVTAKINQDRGCVVFPFAENDKQTMFAVFDGHGEHGDVISNFVMHELQVTKSNIKVKSLELPICACSSTSLEYVSYASIYIPTFSSTALLRNSW
ncbi:unnamed protein product [Chrysoparadoxa australica]